MLHQMQRIITIAVLFSIISFGYGVRFKRQGLGAFGPARTTNKPFIDTDETGGIDLIAAALKITSAPAVDQAFAIVGPANVQTVPTTPRPGGPGGTRGPPPQTTTYLGYLAGSPYPFVVGGPPDIPNFGSKWNGPWGYPLGHIQSFRGTGQYIPNYAYYPLSYFGSALVPTAYSVSG
ncbi:hypothetical protein RvY_01210 [Ramazzottius varieornatus]|uniref:Uncharacterized protein n=1 Tax=Ramazzottius varieornatus TaxID=947166 RepID=A0A1D1UFH6_RAMVA|nr:hypothetical protein RvY_01210 [Ramazzottius varieornatus]